MYVVVVHFDNKEKDYKVFERSPDAVKRYDLAQKYKRFGKIITRLRSGEEVTVSDCKMFKANTANAREAVRLVTEGKAEVFPYPDPEGLDELA